MKKQKINKEGAREAFQFKQFRVLHDEDVMKVGTDAILLGALTSVRGGRVLDIGCGTGVISLILTQRCADISQLVGIDINETAANLTHDNFEKSPWHEKLTAKHASVRSFTLKCKDKFDLIVSNPPFYDQGLLPKNQSKLLAKHTKHLTFKELLQMVKCLLTDDGVFSVILPGSSVLLFLELAGHEGFFIFRRIEIFASNPIQVSRYILEFTLRENNVIKRKSLSVYSANGKYSKKYLELTREFYVDVDSM